MAKVIIDVSEDNGVINWESVKPQIDGAIIRCGYGGNVVAQDDTQYVRNVNECTRLNIPFGVYLFSYARNNTEAQGEADHVLRLVKGRKLQLPIYYDLERTDYVGDLSADLYTQIADAFCKKIEAAGGFVGIYANLNYWQTKLANVNAYTRWLAQWSAAPTFDKSFKLWQYSSDGVIQGSSERTDVSKWYDDFLTMARNHNDFTEGKPVTPPITPPQESETYRVGDYVKFRALYASSLSATPIYDIAVREGTITKIIAGARNPYLINNGTGWVNDAVIEREALKPTKYKKGDVVAFRALFLSSTSTTPITNISVTSGTITKVLPNARNPYLINNGTGWVNDTVIGGEKDPLALQINDKVRVKPGALDYNKTPLAPFVYQNVYDVMEIDNNRVVIGKNNQVTAAVAKDNLIKV